MFQNIMNVSPAELPVLFVCEVLFRWDDEGNRQTQETNILTHINVIKHNHRTRNIKYLIVLVQKKKPSSSDATVEERIARFGVQGNQHECLIHFSVAA